MVKIIVADDHAVMRQGLCRMLQEEESFRIVGQAENGRVAVQLAIELHPDVVIMDVAMPDMNGIEATRQIRKDCPDTKVVALSVHSNKRLVVGILQAGASGYLLKTSEFDEVMKAVRAAVNNQVYLSPEVAGAVVDHIPGREPSEKRSISVIGHLTPREREIFQLLTEGRRPREIAQELFVSRKTVETHRRSIMRKLKAHSLADLTKLAIQEGLTTTDL
jgi:DNA-binding NarL/FixJ family response regulator